ncbi:MAG: TIGR03960 family B12-binding radical SAM protein, partial [bacterium]
VEKPGRYIGNEINSASPGKSLFRVALAFPDTYEIGMSYLGFKILYEILNNLDGVVAERVFAPWGDMEKLLRSQGKPLFSLESKTPLSEFDIVGITLPYELSYTNILNILDLGGIPLESGERDESAPLVIGGGAAVFNPETMAGFFDLFFLGDAEEAIVELVDCCRSAEREGKNRSQLLSDLAGIRGVYLPGAYTLKYDSDGRIREMNGPSRKPQRRILKDLNQAPYPVRPVVPCCAITHDRYTMEISRGCTRGCRFCQAGMTYRPVRERSVEKIGSLVKQGIKNTGHEDLSLASLSVGDYSNLPGLFDRLGERKNLAVSFPSLRAGTLNQESVNFIKSFRKTGFTIAPEAGTDRLRRVINKGISERDILETVRMIFDSGWEGVKLYFMIGLPTETDEDLEGIVKLAREINRIARGSGRRKYINLALSAFTPKPHTPFQWFVPDSLAEIRRKLDFLKRSIPRNIRIKWQNPNISYLENIMSRGDRRLGKVVKEAWRRGARFDAWDENFSLDIWRQSFEACGIDPDYYAGRSFGEREILPWDHLEVIPNKDFLLSEWKKAVEEQLTGDCRSSGCVDCGVCQAAGIPAESLDLSPAPFIKRQMTRREKPVSSEIKIRLQYQKMGNIRFVSHLDLINAFNRALRRAGIQVAYSQGFHPHPRISFCLPLSLGVESVCELCDIHLSEYISPEDFVKLLNQTLPEGLKVVKAGYVSNKNYKLSEISQTQTYKALFKVSSGGAGTDEELAVFLRERVDFLAGSSSLKLVFRKPGGPPKTLDLKPFLRNTGLDLDNNRVDFTLLSHSGNSISPFKLMDVFMDCREREEYRYVLRRVALSNCDPFREKERPKSFKAHKRRVVCG